LDIIPFRNKEGKPRAGFQYRVHRFGPKGKFTVVCPKHTADLACPICDAQFELMGGKKYKDMAPDLQKAFNALWPQERSLHNVRLTDGTFRVWDASDFKVKIAIADKAKLFEQELATEAKDVVFKWASPTEGWMIKFDTEEKAVPNADGKTFFDVKNFDFKERKEQFDASIVDEMVKLDTIMVLEPYEVIEKLYYTQEDDREGVPIEDEAEKPEPIKEPVKESAKPESKPEPVEEKKAPIGKPEMSNNKGGLECPFDGRFGKDFKQLEECAEKCDLYTECRKRSQELKKPTFNEDDLPL
jgi:hypothetical protein